MHEIVSVLQAASFKDFLFGLKRKSKLIVAKDVMILGRVWVKIVRGRNSFHGSFHIVSSL